MKQVLLLILILGAAFSWALVPLTRIDAYGPTFTQRMDAEFGVGGWVRPNAHHPQGLLIQQENADRTGLVILIPERDWANIVQNGRPHPNDAGYVVEVNADGSAQFDNPPALGHVKVYRLPWMGAFVGLQFLP